MNSFRTQLKKKRASFSISYQDKILCVGSCFAEHMGNLLQDYKFSTILNPFGILYNPQSIQRGLSALIHNQLYQEKDLFFHLERWHSFDHHGSFSKMNAKETLNGINQQITNTHKELKQINRLIITLGTAYVFVYKKTGSVVANCHKVPTLEFDRRRLSVDEIITALTKTFQELKTLNTALEIVVTVSPVRHIRDGLIENQRGKATLLLALAELETQLAFVHYFPSYELMLDDLRDYRFYKGDMIHPSETAIQYIWDVFQKTYFEQETLALLQKVEKIISASQHRPLNPETQQHQDFVQTQLEKIKLLESQYDFLDFSREKEGFLTVKD